MRCWFDIVGWLGLSRGSSFNLDFHTIPCHGDDVLLEKHYVSKRSRRQKGMLAFSAQIIISKETIEVRFQKRAHNPLLLAAGFDTTDQVIPWLGRKRLRLVFG